MQKSAKDAKIGKRCKCCLGATVKPNPFTPTFGKVPPYLAGREEIIDEMAQAFTNGPGDPNLSTIIVGARGTGKTALLTCIANEAASLGWITASVSAAPGMLDDILQRAKEAAEEYVSDAEKVSIREIGIPQILSVRLERSSEEKPNWRTKMNRLFKEFEPLGIGLLITVDEVTVKLDEMVQLASVYQHFVRENKRVALIMAGLPYQVSELVNDSRVSFLRRARRQTLGRLPDAEIENALLATVEDAGKRIGEAALLEAVSAIDGFPYMMQLVGYRSWAASRSEEITVSDVKRGAKQAADEFRLGVIETTFRELSPMDIRFCEAMAEHKGSSRLSDVAAHMGVSDSIPRNGRLLDGVMEMLLQGLLCGYEIEAFNKDEVIYIIGRGGLAITCCQELIQAHLYK
ncbi:MAG TPA: ATP-binding protein [Eggerthellaceae bacterium]|nr:ATP-binding protein [Eggerthellaceae bacterium]